MSPGILERWAREIEDEEVAEEVEQADMHQHVGEPRYGSLSGRYQAPAEIRCAVAGRKEGLDQRIQLPLLTLQLFQIVGPENRLIIPLLPQRVVRIALVLFVEFEIWMVEEIFDRNLFGKRNTVLA